MRNSFIIAILALFGITLSLSSKAMDFSEYLKCTLPKYKKKVVTTGVFHTSLASNGNDINIVGVNRSYNSNIDIIPVLARQDTLGGYKSTYSFIKLYPNYVVGVNGSYFSMNTGYPIGLIMIDKEVYTGSIYDRASLGIWDNKFEIDRVSTIIEIKSGNKTIIVDNLNQVRMLSTYVLVYNKRWGKLTPPTPKYGIQVVIDKGVVVKHSLEQQTVPVDGYVLVGPVKIIGDLKIGDKVNMSVKTNPEWDKVTHIISGGPMLVRNGHTDVDTSLEKLNSVEGMFSRTAVGYMDDGTLIIVTVSGSGMTLTKLAKLMESLGCVRAMGLDGGSSTSLYIKGIGSVASPTVRSLSNILLVKEN